MVGAVKTTSPVPKEDDVAVHINPKDRGKCDDSV